MNGWFPDVGPDGRVLSGDTEVWLTERNGSSRKLTNGGFPKWIGPNTFCYNNRLEGVDAKTYLRSVNSTAPYGWTPKTFGKAVVGAGFGDHWAGFDPTGGGKVFWYDGDFIVRVSEESCCPSYGPGTDYGYLTPYQSDPVGFMRQYRRNEVTMFTGKLTEAAGGVAIEATGTYSRRMVGTPSITQDEVNLVCRDGWVCTYSNAAAGLLLRPIGSIEGYFLKTVDFYNHSFRILGGENTLVLAGSQSNGTLIQREIALSDKMVNLIDAANGQPPPAPQPKKPEVTVDVFNFGPPNGLKDGEYLLFHDRENTQGAIVRVWVERASMYMSIEYPGIGLGQTGAFRRVR